MVDSEFIGGARTHITDLLSMTVLPTERANPRGPASCDVERIYVVSGPSEGTGGERA
jgi:hypothetical protein